MDELVSPIALEVKQGGFLIENFSSLLQIVEEALQGYTITDITIEDSNEFLSLNTDSDTLALVA